MTHRRHHWRSMGFDELSELYTSMLFRSVAMSLAGIFVPIYLYEKGYAVWQILFFFAIVFITQVIVVYPVARIIARIGPKHTILYSYLFQVTSMTGLILIDQYQLFGLIAVCLGIANISFFTAFHIDFSKVKHSKHGGKEVGWLYTMERSGAIFGPIVGGLVAYAVGPQYTFGVAILLLILGVVPLFLTKEPVKTNQHINIIGLRPEAIKRDLLSYGAFVIETAVSITIWPLFLGVIVFRENAYVQLGGIVSASIIAGILVAHTVGKVVDDRKGRELLRFGTVVNALLHLFRPVTSSFASALAVNVANEGITACYRMPYLKGMYDAADDHPGYRIVYIASMEAAGAVARGLFFLVAAALAYFWTADRALFIVLFSSGAAASLLIMLERFPALKKR